MLWKRQAAHAAFGSATYRWRYFIGTTAIALTITGVTASTPSSAQPVRSAARLTPLNVTLALIPPKMLFMGFYAAEKEGFFSRNGLNVNLLPEMGGVQAQRVAASGQAVVVAGAPTALQRSQLRVNLSRRSGTFRRATSR